MKFCPRIAALIALSTNAYASSIPALKRSIPNVGEHTMRGNISSIASWAYAALAYATTTASNSTSDLSYLCANFDTLSTRYVTAFPEPTGDMAKFARDAICGASKSSNPSPLPVAQNQLWYMKSYIAAIFTVQGYYGTNNLTDSLFFLDLCWYVEGGLLRGLWVPCRDTDEGVVDAESSYCASGGYFGKGEYSMYTNATQPADIARKADVLVSRLMASVLKIVLKEEKQINYVCDNFSKFAAGIEIQGLVNEVIKEMVCKEKKVVEVQQARREMLSIMTDLYILQLLNAGNDSGYHAYLCKTLKSEGFDRVGLDGKKVVDAACRARP